MFSGIIEVEHWLTMGLKTFDNALTYCFDLRVAR